MANLEFYIVDVFAIGQYTGNQLAVFPTATGLSLATMQQIAKEINFSESTFITGPAAAGIYPVKIFTPAVELPFAGHPTLGTAWVIQKILDRPVESVTLQYTAGQIPVAFNYEGVGDGALRCPEPVVSPADDLAVRAASPIGEGSLSFAQRLPEEKGASPWENRPTVLWMTQRPPEFLGQLAANQLAPVLQIDPADIDDRYPIEQVSTGLPFIIVPLKTLAAVQRAKLQIEAYYELIQDLPAQSILIFCPETLFPENQLHVRVFTHALGIPEDPATGSANGCLAAYLVRHQYQGQSQIDWRVEQGYEIDRPSLLFLRAQPGTIEVGGQVALVASGQWHHSSK
jgi:trans-2,3-dihydro-3-hydroxyanthranilate isomerase